jgi:hypothetical protein
VSRNDPTQPIDYIRQVNTDAGLPKSTLIVGGAMWLVLFTLTCWHLNKTDSLRDKVGDMSEKVSVISTKTDATVTEVATVKSQVSAVDNRLRDIESRQIRNGPR